MRHRYTTQDTAGLPANDPAFPTPGIVTSLGSRRQARPSVDPGQSRFVTQSHAVSAPIASPRALFIAATIAVALYLIGRRLSD